MKVGLNATCFNERPSGAKQRFIGIYGELIKRLPEVEFVVYEPSNCRVGAWFDGAQNISVRRSPIPSNGRLLKFVNGVQYWQKALKYEEFDLLEGFNLPLVTSPVGKTVLTVHDIRGVNAHNGFFSRAVFKTALMNSLKSAERIITVSEAMKKEILGFYPGLPVSVIYNGIDSAAFDRTSNSEMQVFLRKYALPKDFILAVGHFEQRKNYLNLIDAIALLRDRGVSCFLLVIGNDSGMRAEVEERIESTNLSGSVKILCDLSDMEVRCAYKLSRLFVFPSSYEGFGIPILEAMAAGCPMALSDIPVFREITQNKGVYFPYDDIDSMAFTIEKTLSSSSERLRLISYGRDRVQFFNFRNLAVQMGSLYKSLM